MVLRSLLDLLTISSLLSEVDSQGPNMSLIRKLLLGILVTVASSTYGNDDQPDASQASSDNVGGIELNDDEPPRVNFYKALSDGMVRQSGGKNETGPQLS